MRKSSTSFHDRLSSVAIALRQSIAGGGLKARVLRGGALMGAGSVVEHGLRFLRNIILTRLLMPEALGVMTIILAVNAALESFTEVGIREAVVQHPDAQRRTFLNAAWWFATGRGAVLCAIGFLLAPQLASFYHVTQARGLLTISFVAILLNGALSTRAFVALKKMRYLRWVAIMQGAALGGVCVTLVLVWLLRDIRALVYGYIAEAALRIALSFILCPFKPGLAFEKAQTKELFRFARGMAGVPMLTFLFLQADIFVLGRVVTKHDLGLYGMAGSLAGAPAVLISIFINPILMPAFAQIRDQYERINTALLKTTRAMSLTGFPLCAWVLLFGPGLMRVVYGPAYEAAGSVLAILFCATVLRTMASPIPAVYLGIGQPALNRIFAAIRSGIIILIIYPSVLLFGMKGAASAGAISMIIAWIFQVRQMGVLTHLDTKKYGISVATGLAGAGVVGGVGYLVRSTLGSSMITLFGVGVLCATVAAAGVALVRRDFGSSDAANDSGIGKDHQQGPTVFVDNETVPL
jgi:PST family polysaccharide transporter/lipopolysaccharide exporter